MREPYAIFGLPFHYTTYHKEPIYCTFVRLLGLSVKAK